MWEMLSLLFTETSRYIGYIVTTLILLLLLRILWTYVSISTVLFFTVYVHVISEPEYKKRNGNVVFLIFKQSFNLPYVFSLSGGRLKQEYLEPVPVFSINYDFTGFWPRWTITYRNTMPVFNKIEN